MPQTRRDISGESATENAPLLIQLYSTTPPTTTDVRNVVLMFACFSSCKGSLDRRPFEIIFALERRGLILGCDSLELRIVAAPARDCCKAEKRVLNKVARGQQLQAGQQAATEATGEPPAKRAAKHGKNQTNASGAAGGAADEKYNITVSSIVNVDGGTRFLALR